MCEALQIYHRVRATEMQSENRFKLENISASSAIIINKKRKKKRIQYSAIADPILTRPHLIYFCLNSHTTSLRASDPF